MFKSIIINTMRILEHIVVLILGVIVINSIERRWAKNIRIIPTQLPVLDSIWNYHWTNEKSGKIKQWRTKTLKWKNNEKIPTTPKNAYTYLLYCFTCMRVVSNTCRRVCVCCYFFLWPYSSSLHARRTAHI